MRTTLFALMVTGGMALLGACSDAAGPAVKPSVSLSFATSNTASNGASAGSAATSMAHSLVITRVEVVLDRIELLTANATCADDVEDSGHQSAADDHGDHPGSSDHGDDACQEISGGPQLVDVPVGSAVVTMLQVPVPAGTYVSLEARLEPASGPSADATAFLSVHPEFAGASVRVEGTFDGTPFVYIGAPRTHLEFSFDPPLAVGSSGANVTVHIALDRWFATESGALIDPATANAGGPNAELVAHNIRRSFRAFRDDHRRGDDGRGDGDGSGNDHGDDGAGHD